MINARFVALASIVSLACAVSHAHAQWSINGSKVYYNAGNVGVGTGNPAYKLDVRSSGTRAISAQATATSGNTIGVYALNKSTGGKALFGKASATSGVNYGVYGESSSPDGYGGYFVGDVNVDGGLLLNDVTVVRDDGFGRREFFHENGTEHMEFNGSNTTFDNVTVYVVNSLRVAYPANTPLDAELDVNGDISCFSLTQTSGREFKQDIAPLAGALESIMQLQGVTYAWNDKAPACVQGRRDIGFIADEVNAVLPDIVARDQNGKPVGIDYGKITPVAVEAIKQLKAENDQLKARLERLEALVAAQAADKSK